MLDKLGRKPSCTSPMTRRPELVTAEVPGGVALDDQKNYSQCIKLGFPLILRGQAGEKQPSSASFSKTNARPGFRGTRPGPGTHPAGEGPRAPPAPPALRPRPRRRPGSPRTPAQPSPGPAPPRGPPLSLTRLSPCPAGAPRRPRCRHRGTPSATSAPRTGRRCFYAPFATAGKEAVAARAGAGPGQCEDGAGAAEVKGGRVGRGTQKPNPRRCHPCHPLR